MTSEDSPHLYNEVCQAHLDCTLFLQGLFLTNMLLQRLRRIGIC